jgi:hypothetical protein
LKVRYLGIAGAIIAFISYALPWWTLFQSGLPGTASEASLYINEAAASFPASMTLWYAWTALVLVIMAGVLGLMGSLVQSTRIVLLVGGVFAVFSVAIFAAGLQTVLSNLGSSFWGLPAAPTVGLFSSGSFSELGYTINYTTYLSLGFWLAVVAAIAMLAACLRTPVATAPTPQPLQPVPQGQPPT